ncbi:hypothetical protein M885DRAFT_518674 [Pelagophyceae sp. CCMP2097]|nr:hypothetical protein M885DRAFT_518674 [Pelagophyceae sp. CCMP2097]
MPEPPRFRVLATWPFLVEEPRVVDEPRRVDKPRLVEVPRPASNARRRPDVYGAAAATPADGRDAPSRRRGSEEDAKEAKDDAAPAAAAPAAADNVLEVWEGRHTMDGGLLAALEKINTLLDAPPDDDYDRYDMEGYGGAYADAPDASALDGPATKHALRKLVSAMTQCAAASTFLTQGGGGAVTPDKLFRVADPHGDGCVDQDDLEALMRSCGLDESEVAAVSKELLARSDKGLIYEATFAQVVSPLLYGETAHERSD